MQGDVLDAHRAGLHKLQGGDIDLGEFDRASRNRGAGDQARRDSLGVGFHGLRQVEMAPQVEQGDLADAAAFAPGFDQAVTVVGLAGGVAAGGNAADYMPRG